MKICLFEVVEDEKKEYFSQKLSGHDLTFLEDPLSRDSFPAQTDFDIISVFIRSQVDDKVISAFPDLKHISTRSTGFDHIDVDFAKAKNITVSSVPSYGSNTVAEFTFGLILSLSRRIPQAVTRLKSSEDFVLEGLRGFDLNGKTLGIIGTGKIGMNVIKIAKGFNMRVLAYDPFAKEEVDFQYVPLEDLLRNSDIVTIHAPYSKENHHLISKDNIKLMKKGALLVNTSRGGLVDTDALFSALTNGQIAGAALDVLEEEGELKEEAELLIKGEIKEDQHKTILEDHILIHHPNVIITPHMAFYSKEAEFSIMETTAGNILAAVSGTPQNLV